MRLTTVIHCEINGVIYKLKVLVSEVDKCVGLKAHAALPKDCGLIFVYSSDQNSKFDFSEIGYQCRIIFLNSDCNIIHQDVTVAYQKELIVCPKLYRYVIEVGRY